ncbi:hypothetical protein B7R21_06065 [Subtercola boreus]|uniref:ABC transporter domain-containing protein n=1 Tax=Subtercola boreus TaxID=120213 RepID=A0A3E0VWZ4_9MICO|nr:sugar ABC transporter ATP-binding protein [Subtercola boreus]RFA14604.1 hypothetical protein B7R21_06065 [Subtercola boreus]
MATNPDRSSALVVDHVSKTFGSITVLNDVSFSIARGETVGLIGENGSGKSTFIKVLSGFHAPDRGAVVSMGERDISGVLAAGPTQTGLGFIHQDLALVENLTIVENLRISQFTTGLLGRIRWRQEERIVAGMIAKVGLTMSPTTLVSDLSVTDRALVAIARGLAEIDSAGTDRPRLLVLDEPTAYLPAEGVARLFAAVRRLTEDGTSILFVSHRLDEVIDHCERVIVFRGGNLVADELTEGQTERDLVTLMLGRSPEGLYPDYNERSGETVLTVEKLSGGTVEEVGFSARAGEIVGFIGLPGGGYEHIPYLLSGASRPRSGSITIDGARVDARAQTPQSAIARGIALLPADRKNRSGAQTLSLAENVTIATLSKFRARGVMLDAARERTVVREQIDNYSIQAPHPDAALSSLSGGNQQKALLAKWVIAEPRVYALHEPTQGVDVGAKRDVFRQMAGLAAEGTVLVIASVEYEDLARLCTRVHVVKAGRITLTIERDDLSAHALAVAVHER